MIINRWDQPPTAWWTENYYKKKVHLKSFQNPFLLCPGSAQLAIRTWSVIGTTITKFHFRFLLHRINSCFCILVPFFTNYCWLYMNKTCWNWEIWWNSKPEGQPDPDWTQIWTPGACPIPKSGLTFEFFLSLNLKLDTLLGYTNPSFVPKGPPIGPKPTWFWIWPWLNPTLDPGGLTHPKNVGSICGYFLNFSLKTKMGHMFWSCLPNFGTQGPDPTQFWTLRAPPELTQPYGDIGGIYVL